MVIQVWPTHGEPINRVAKRGIHYEVEPKVPEWILRDRTKEGLTAHFMHHFKRIEFSAASSNFIVKTIDKRWVKINPIEDAESVVTRLKDCIASTELCLFCIQVIAGNLQHLQRINRWAESVRQYFQHRLSGLRRRLPEETLAAFDHLLQVVSFPKCMPLARIQPPIWFSKKSARGRKAKPKKDAPKITISKRRMRLMMSQGLL